MIAPLPELPLPLATILHGMPVLWHRPLAMLPPANPELLAVTACSVVLFTTYFYTVQYVLNRKSIVQSERQKSWVLTVLSR